MLGTVSHATEQGPRKYQEDRFFASQVPVAGPMGWFLAVMDGHGGSRAADACLEELPRAFEASLSFQQGEIVLRYTVEKLVRATKDMEEGSTLSLVWVREDRDEATIAVIGDSPVLNQRTPHE